MLTLVTNALAAPIAAPVEWKTVVLDRAFRSEGVAVFDVDRDGRLDVVAGEVWYRAPRWEPNELAPPGAYDPIAAYSDCFVGGSADVDRDGWTDFLSVGFPGGEARWFRNPANAPGHWTRHVIAPAASNESPAFVDVDGDGRTDLLMGLESARRVVWLEPGPDPTAPWIAHAIGQPGQPGFRRFDHGLGLGDVDGDQRADVLTAHGWYSSPPDPRSSPWPFTPADWVGPGSAGAAQIGVQDVDRDGDQDVITSSPHAYGVWWWERTGASNWIRRELSTEFSQAHALCFADVDGDGVRDVVTGKRWYAHGPSGDPGSQEPAVLVWFRMGGGGVGGAHEKHVIHRDSGVGTQFVTIDVDADGRTDVVTSNKKGVYVHFRR